jgi:hypothetical protein
LTRRSEKLKPSAFAEQFLSLFWGEIRTGGEAPHGYLKKKNKKIFKKNEQRNKKTILLYKKGGRSPPFPSEPRAKRGASEVKEYFFF